MGQYRHPWDFGITPSRYIKSRGGATGPYLGRAIEELGQGRYETGIERLDDLFRHTLECPPMRMLESELRERVSCIGGKEAVLVASFARPGCYFFSMDKENAKAFFSDSDIVSKLGNLYLEELDKESSDAVKNPEIDKMGALNMSFSRRLNEECIGITRVNREGRVSRGAYDLITGIAFGFPVGDVVEVAAGSHHEPLEPSVVSHSITPTGWSGLWREKVGREGERQLAEIYKRVLGIGAEK